MNHPIHWLRGATAAVMLTALVSGVPAASASPSQLAQTTPPPAASAQTPPRHPRKAVAQRPRTLAALTDARVKELHTKLQITTAQEPQFTAMADIMRANAQAMDALLREQSQDTDRTAVSALHWYERLTEAHAAALQKFVPAFAALYSVLSDSQRKSADGMFQRLGPRPLSRHKHRTG